MPSRSHIYSWIVLGVLSTLYLLENFDRYLISVSIIPYIDYSSYEYSLIVGPVFTLIYAFGGLIFSLAHSDSGDGILRKVSSGKFAILFVSTLFFSVAFGLSAVCYNFWQQVLVRIFMGLAQSVITPFSASIIRSMFPPDQCGTAFSIFNTGVYVAFSMSLSLGEWMYDRFGWKAGYALFGIIGAAFSFVIPLVGWWSSRSTAFDENKQSSIPVSYNPLVTEDLQNHQSSSPAGMLSIRGLSLDQHHQRYNSGQLASVKRDELSFPASLIPGSSFDDQGSEHNSIESFETVGMQSVVDNSDMIHRASMTTISDEANNTLWSYFSWKSLKASIEGVKRKLYRIVVLHWWEHPSVFFLCLATGVRLGAGYVWSSYTGPFFSDLFVHQENSIHCRYSWNGEGNIPGMCSSADYPYCVSGTCSAVSKYPWHDQGMDPIDIATYMSWVPLFGSALGNLLGGVVSDKIIRGEWLISSSATASSTSSSKGSFSSAGRPQIAADERFPWRALISGVSTILSLPIVCISFYMDFPGCFLIYIATGLVGEMYLSQTLALITDKIFISADLISPSVALFVLVTTAIAGNATLLVPFFEEFTSREKVTIIFQAQSSDPNAAGNVMMSFTQNSSMQLQQALVYSMILCYGLSGILYICAYLAMIRKQGV